MSTSDRVVLGVLIAVGIGVYWHWSTTSGGSEIPKPDTVFVTQSRAVAETTRLRVTQFRDRYIDTSRVDTLRDTIKVPVKELVTVFAQCEECARKLDSAAAKIKAKDDTIYQLRKALQRCEKQKPLWAGAAAGACLLLRR